MKNLNKYNKMMLGGMLAAFTLTACEDYTEHNFGKDKDLYNASQVNTQNIVLTDANYAEIASNAENVAKAKAAQVDTLRDAEGYDSIVYPVLESLKAVATDKCFNGDISAAEYIQPVLKSLVGATQYYTMTDGSVINVTYNQQKDLPAYLEALQNIPSVTVEGTFTPTTLKDDMSDAIAAKMPGAAMNDIALVNFQYSDVELPVATEEAEPALYYSQTFAESIGDFTLSDVTLPEGATYVWAHNAANGYMKASGYFNKANRDAESWLTSPVIDLTKANEPELNFTQCINKYFGTVANEATVWVKAVGGQWSQLAITYPELAGTWSSFEQQAIDLSSYKGKKIQVAFKYASTTAGAGTWEVKNVYVADKGYSTEEPATVRRKVINKLGYNKSLVYKFNGSKWAEYTATGVTVEPIDPSVYVSLGKTSISTPDATLPSYLSNTFPYAAKDKVVAVVYNNGKANVATEYTFDGTAWNKTVNTEVATVTYTLDEDGWTAKADYLNCALTALASTDAAAIKATYGWSIEYKGSIGDLTYVWSATTSYGLKASAYANKTDYPTDSWAVTPVMNMKKAKAPVLTFEEAQKYCATPLSDYLKVMVSTDYTAEGGISAATWTDLTDKLQGERPDGTNWNFYPVTLDLSAYAGQRTVTVAFRYISTDTSAATWEFKNVVCKEAE